MAMNQVSLSPDIQFANDRPFVLIGGMNVIETDDLLFSVAEEFVRAASELGIPFVFKASFDKANRSSINSYRGPGIEAGLAALDQVKRHLDVPILTDIHETWQASAAAEVADIIQLPAFLARQTDLVAAMARTGKVINIKKPQFLAPAEMRHILAKFGEAGNDRLLLCERGSCFGYNNLVVDMLGMDQMKEMAPVVFDVTHALQRPGGRSDSADGRGKQAAALARAGLAIGIAGLFVEAHPDPAQALCDGPSALPLAELRSFLVGAMAVDAAVKPGPGRDGA
ncbi:MAG TPA: 3-deoxy-8-phosphooctulonate synthase [Sphingomicrobium sp.]|nr:3-deoxy-8-phosphooctulonate synthase [Sphingomicrobium sp.]